MELPNKLGFELISKVASEFKSQFFPWTRNCLGTEDESTLVQLEMDWTSNIAEIFPNSIEDTDESYSLTIEPDSKSIKVSANEYSGIVRALTTLS